MSRPFRRQSSGTPEPEKKIERTKMELIKI